MLDGLVRRPVLPKPDRVVRHHERDRHLGEGRQAQRRAQVIGKDEERRDVRTNPAVQDHPIGRTGHCVLADAKVKVRPPRMLLLVRRTPLHVRPIRACQIRGPPNQITVRGRGNGIKRVAASVAS